MKKLDIVVLGLLSGTMLHAEDTKTININPGELSISLSPVEKSSITNLVITGIMDARDFLCIRDSLTGLTSLDISSVTIAAYKGSMGTQGADGDYNYLPNSIPQGAFMNPIAKVLKSISLPKTISEIGLYSFYGCKVLNSIVLPSGLTTIDDFAFANCSNLNNLIIPPSVLKLGKSVFMGTGIINVDINNPNFISEEGVVYDKMKTTIFHCDISKQKYILPSTVSIIDDGAFSDCVYLDSINLSSSINTIGNYAFYNCIGIKTIIIPPLVTFIGNYSFFNCANLTSIEMPSSITEIGNFAFSHCGVLSTINLPSSLLSIGNSAFSFCYLLTKINLPPKVSTIGVQAFAYCYSITDMIIPESVTILGNFMFYGSVGLISIKVMNKKPIDLSGTGFDNVFLGINTANCILYVPEGSKAIYQTTKQWQDFENIITFSTNGVLNIITDDIIVYLKNGQLVLEKAPVGKKLTVYSSSGAKIYDRAISNENIEISIPASGLYIVCVGGQCVKVVR